MSFGIIHGVHCDVTNENAIEKMAADVEMVGGADIVVANAGIWEEADVTSLDADRFARMLNVNVIGAYLSSRAFIGHLDQLAQNRQGSMGCASYLNVAFPSE